MGIRETATELYRKIHRLVVTGTSTFVGLVTTNGDISAAGNINSNTGFQLGGATIFATQADVEGNASSTTLISPAVVRYNRFAVKAWAKIANSGVPAVSEGVNVSSITDNGVGDFTVNFTLAFSTATYAYFCTSRSHANGAHTGQNSATGPATGSCRFLTSVQGVGPVDVDCAVGFMGDH